MEVAKGKFYCSEHTGTTEYDNAEELRAYLDSMYAGTYFLKNHGEYMEVVCNSAVVGVIKKKRV